MATTQATLTPSTDTAPAVANVSRELSGAQWVSRFPGSSSTEDLAPNFRSSASNFISALKSAGATVHISATYRPRERAYLMHYSAKIAKGVISPSDVPPMNGVNIEWDHGDAAQSQQAAQSMVNGYGIVFPPALISRHTERAAIDMTISGIIGRTMKNAEGTDIEITSNTILYQVGATYGCHKLLTDPPHWSDDGH